MEGGDAVVGQAQNIERLGIDRRQGLVDLLGADLHGRRRQVEAIELAGQLAQGVVTATAHIGDDLRHRLLDPGRRLLAALDEHPEERFETFIVKPHHAHGCSTPLFWQNYYDGQALSGNGRLLGHHLFEGLDERGDPRMLGLEAGAVDDQAAGDLGDRLDLDQAVLLQGGTGRHQVDDAL